MIKSEPVARQAERTAHRYPRDVERAVATGFEPVSAALALDAFGGERPVQESVNAGVDVGEVVEDAVYGRRDRHLHAESAGELARRLSFR